MTKVICASEDCEYCSADHICTQKELKLADCYYQTVYEGRQHFWKCKQYKKSAQAQHIEEMLADYVDNLRNLSQKNVLK